MNCSKLWASFDFWSGSLWEDNKFHKRKFQKDGLAGMSLVRTLRAIQSANVCRTNNAEVNKDNHDPLQTPNQGEPNAPKFITFSSAIIQIWIKFDVQPFIDYYYPFSYTPSPLCACANSLSIDYLLFTMNQAILVLRTKLESMTEVLLNSTCLRHIQNLLLEASRQR